MKRKKVKVATNKSNLLVARSYKEEMIIRTGAMHPFAQTELFS